MKRILLYALTLATFSSCTDAYNTYISLRNNTGQQLTLDSNWGLANIARGETKREIEAWIYREDRPSDFTIATPTVTWTYSNYQDAAISGLREFRRQRRFDGHHIYAAIDSGGSIWLYQDTGSVAVLAPQPSGFPLRPSSKKHTPRRA